MEDINRRNTYLSFKLHNEFYAIDVKNVIEVLEQQTITEVPDAPSFINGVINFRGDVVPVINLARKLHLTNNEIEKYVIIILEIEKEQNKIRIGMMCDKVKDVIQYSFNEIKEMPELGNQISSEYVQGMVNDKDKIVTLLDMGSIVQSNKIIETVK